MTLLLMVQLYLFYINDCNELIEIEEKKRSNEFYSESLMGFFNARSDFGKTGFSTYSV